MVGIAGTRRDPNRTAGETVMREADAAQVPLNACSACSGDYEDPERAASNDASEEEDAGITDIDDDAQSMARERFPVRDQ